MVFDDVEKDERYKYFVKYEKALPCTFMLDAKRLNEYEHIKAKYLFNNGKKISRTKMNKIAFDILVYILEQKEKQEDLTLINESNSLELITKFYQKAMF